MHQINHPSGPVFEAGPGWGAKTKQWLGRYFFKVIVPMAVVVLVIYAIAARSPNSAEDSATESPAPTITPSISIEVNRGDSRISIARRALAKYLTLSPGELTDGQKLFIETEFGQKTKGIALKIGETIDINIDDLKAVIEKSKTLTKTQLDKWEVMVKNFNPPPAPLVPTVQ